MNEWAPVVASVLIALIGSGAGWAAWRRASAESRKDQADANRSIVGGAADLAKLLREQMGDMSSRISVNESRLDMLEQTVGAWEGWGTRVLDLLDRALGMIASDHADSFRKEVEAARRARPPHHSRDRDEPPGDEPAEKPA